MHYTTLHYTTLHYTTPHYTTLHYTKQKFNILHCKTLYYTTGTLYFPIFSKRILLAILRVCNLKHFHMSTKEWSKFIHKNILRVRLQNFVHDKVGEWRDRTSFRIRVSNIGNKFNLLKCWSFTHKNWTICLTWFHEFSYFFMCYLKRCYLKIKYNKFFIQKQHPRNFRHLFWPERLNMCNRSQTDTLRTYGPVFVCQEFVPHICILDLKNIYFTYIVFPFPQYFLFTETVFPWCGVRCQVRQLELFYHVTCVT